MAKRPTTFTEAEIEAILAVSGDANSWETCLSVSVDEKEATYLHDAYENGIAKLVDLLVRKRKILPR